MVFVFSLFLLKLSKILKLLVILLSLHLLLYLLNIPTQEGGSGRPSDEEKTCETWELLRFCALNFLELFRTKERSTSSFYGHYELVFFSDNQNFHTIIYRRKQYFYQFFFFCQTNFVSLVTENRFMVYNILASQRILMKASPIFFVRN